MACKLRSMHVEKFTTDLRTSRSSVDFMPFRAAACIDNISTPKDLTEPLAVFLRTHRRRPEIEGPVARPLTIDPVDLIKGLPSGAVDTLDDLTQGPHIDRLELAHPSQAAEENELGRPVAYPLDLLQPLVGLFVGGGP